MKILFIGAHPDDIEIGCESTIYNLKSSDEYKVYFLVLTDGEKGGDPDVRLSEM